MSDKTTEQTENQQEQVVVEVSPNDTPAPESPADDKTKKKPRSGKPAPPPEILQRQVEAILLTIERPMTAGKIAETLDLDASKPVNDAVDALNAFYDKHKLSFRIEKVAAGFQILTLPDFKDVLATLHKKKIDNKLSGAAMEALAIIAYKQPIIRADIEAIRGVASGEIVRSLMDKHLVKIVGRAEEIGRPMLYGTTRTFLEVFGLSSLKDLPQAEELLKP